MPNREEQQPAHQVQRIPVDWIKLLLIIFGMGGSMVTGMFWSENTSRNQYIAKDDYRLEQQMLDHRLTRIEGKLDKLLLTRGGAQ